MNATENEHVDQREQTATPDPKTSNMLFGVIAVALVAAIVSIAILSLDREPTKDNQPLPAPIQPSTPELPNNATVDTSLSTSGTIPVVIQMLLPRSFENLSLNIEDDDVSECVDYDCTEYLEFAYWSSADYSLSFSGVALKGTTLETFIPLMVGDLPLAPLSLTHGVVGKAGLDGEEYVLFFASHGYVVGLSCDYVECRAGMADFAHFLITRMYKTGEGAATIPTDHPTSTATVIEPSVQTRAGEVSDIPTPIPPKDVVFATYGNVSSDPHIHSTIIDATAIHPSDALPRTVTLGDTSFIITDITFTNSPTDSAPEGNVSLSLTTDYLHPTGAPERIVYLYRHDVAWQEGYDCTTGILCGSGSPSSLYHTHNTERPATLEEVMRAYPNLPEATLTQWTTVGYTLYTRYNIKVHSFEYSRTTGAWNSVKLILERQEEVMPPNEPTWLGA